MNPEQKFDKIIKKKVDEAEFPFDEKNWNKLSMQLDSERRVAAAGGWGKYLYLGLLFLGITSASIALYKIENPFGIKNELVENASEIDNSISETRNVNNNKYSSLNSENNLLASNNVVSENNELIIQHTNSESSNSSENNNSLVDNNLNESLNTVLKSKILNENNAGYVDSKKEVDNNSTLKNTRNSLGMKNALNLKNNNANTKDANEMSSTERTESELAGGVFLEHTVLDRIDSKLPYVYSIRNVKLGPVKIPSWYLDDYHRKGKKRMSFLNAEVGAAFMLGWNSDNGKDGRGLNWYAGLNYGKFITPKVGFSAGSQFYNISHINQSFYESSKSVYGLGSTSSNTIITAQSLFYFSVPVKFYYAINSSNQVGFSANTSFLFSSENKVENFRLTDNVKSSEIVTNSSGIYEGVRLNNILLSTFYKVKLNKRVFLNTEVFYGVRDIFKNTNSNNYTQKPIGFRVGLQYTLLEK
ncbi:MAG: hypothetical protein Q7W45_17180 [Bacteroidota bacterium]|nr:hypothetical protein [Bacteroidota bacterium]MDP3145251.1 hypothetical protein [Bacteroidota bacterium]